MRSLGYMNVHAFAHPHGCMYVSVGGWVHEHGCGLALVLVPACVHACTWLWACRPVACLCAYECLMWCKCKRRRNSKAATSADITLPPRTLALAPLAMPPPERAFYDHVLGAAKWVAVTRAFLGDLLAVRSGCVCVCVCLCVRNGQASGGGALVSGGLCAASTGCSKVGGSSPTIFRMIRSCPGFGAG